jgi:hypothetical protein
MKAANLLKANIDALLRARHQTNHDLAQWCRRSDAWLSKILGKDNRNIPLEYLDRMADFFGLAAYQLFQPGLAGLLERRKAERRTGRDRRLSAINHQLRESVSATVANLSGEDVADLLRLKSLSAGSRDELRQAALTLQRSERQVAGRKPRRNPVGTDAVGAPAPTVRSFRTREKVSTEG